MKFSQTVRRGLARNYSRRALVAATAAHADEDCNSGAPGHDRPDKGSSSLLAPRMPRGTLRRERAPSTTSGPCQSAHRPRPS